MTAVPDLIQPAWERLDPHTCQLGESPFWHPQEQSLYWVDISGKQLLRRHAGVLQTWDMPSEPGCIAPARSGGLVIALRHGIFRARQWGGALTQIATLAYDTATVRANDGKCDALGRFWVGTVDETKTQHAAALYSVDARDASAAPHITQQFGGALPGLRERKSVV
jgi:sugar lactone lactonase YvrE